MLERDQIPPKLSTTNGKYISPPTSTNSLFRGSFSVSPFRAVNPGEEAECVKAPE